MLTTHCFPPEVCEKLGNYVYRLIDPRNRETFYVGKGRNNRVFDHAAGLPEICNDASQQLGAKLDRIRVIKNAGLNVLHVIHRHEIPDEAVFEVEASLIDTYPGLSNIRGGHASSDRGPMNHLELIDKYALPELPPIPEQKLILININNMEDLSDRRATYNLVRYCWRLSKARAENADHVLAVVRGIVVGAFRPRKRMSDTQENFPNIPYADGSKSHPIGFIGDEAEKHIWDLYVGERGKRVTNPDLKHTQNPIRFWQCSSYKA